MAVLFCVLPRSFFEKSSIEEDQERPRENSVTTIAENELQKKTDWKKRMEEVTMATSLGLVPRWNETTTQENVLKNEQKKLAIN